MSKSSDPKFERDMATTIEIVRGTVPKDLVSDEFVNAWIDVVARKDASVVEAWVSRDKDRRHFDGVLTRLSEGFEAAFMRLLKEVKTQQQQSNDQLNKILKGKTQ